MNQNMRMVYLASPYTCHMPNGERDYVAEHANYAKAVEATGFLMKKGDLVYSPIVHWHVVDLRFPGEIGYEDYLAADMEMLRRCDELHVLMLDDYKESNGIKVEVFQANIFAKPVKYCKLTETGVIYVTSND